MSSLRVLMLLENNAYPGDSRVRQEATTLAAAGHRVTVIAPRGDDQPRREDIDGVSVIRFRPPPEGDGAVAYLVEYGWAVVAMFAATLGVAVRAGFDVVHVHNPPDLLVLIAAPYKLLGKRFVYDHHDFAPELYEVLFEQDRPAIRRALRLFEWVSARLADLLVTTNETARRRHLDRNGPHPDDVFVVRNGPDLRLIRDVEPAPAARRAGRLTILYIGSMGRHDGVELLVDAMENLFDEHGRTDAFFVLVGDGAAGDDVRARCRSLGPDRAIATGWIDHTEVSAYLSAADICVAPEPSNPYNDGCTVIKLMEYMALGKPIVAFDLPEHRITAGPAALYARPNDTQDFARRLSDLMDDEPRRNEMGAAARERVIDHLAWHHQADRLLAAYERLG